MIFGKRKIRDKIGMRPTVFVSAHISPTYVVKLVCAIIVYTVWKNPALGGLGVDRSLFRDIQLLEVRLFSSGKTVHTRSIIMKFS